MKYHFGTFVMGVIVILILMLINIAGGAYYQELKRSRSADALVTGTHIPDVLR